MNKIIINCALLLIVFGMFYSCKTHTNIECGVFKKIYFPDGNSKKKQESGEQLVLNLDGTFELSVYDFSGIHFSSCSGKWHYIAKDTILIEGVFKPSFDHNPRDIQYRTTRKVKVINQNKIKMIRTYGIEEKYIKLKRVDSAYIYKDWYQNRYGIPPR